MAADKYLRALDIDSDHVDAHAGLANNLLADGQFADGWQHFLRRNSVLAIVRHLDRTPLAADLSGSHVIVLADPGLGDQVFFARHLPELRARGAPVTIRIDPRIAEMLHRSGITDKIAPDANPADGDRVISVGDLPFLLNCEDNSALPPPYKIVALPEREDTFRSHLSVFGARPWIGVTWRAGTPNMRQALLKEELTAFFAAALREKHQVRSSWSNETLRRARQTVSRQLSVARSSIFLRRTKISKTFLRSRVCWIGMWVSATP
jgi:hypothetical protein